MRVGIVGVHDGHIAGMIKNAERVDEVEFIGVVESDDNAYERLGNDLPRFKSIDDLLDDAKPDIILEGLNHAEKTELVAKAAEAGVNLVLDKPLCRTLDDWKIMKKAVDKSGISITMWFTSRWHAPFVKLREYIEAGDLGDLVSFISTHPHKMTKRSARWYFDPNIYTGTFHDISCHGVDHIRHLTNAEYTGVHALSTQIKYAGTALNDHVQASFKMSNGSCAVVTSDWLTPQESPAFGDTRFIIMGTEGSAHLKAYAKDHLLVISNKKGQIEPDFSDIKQQPYMKQVVEAYSKGEEPSISTEDVFAVAKACLMAEESAKRDGEFLKLT